MNVTDRLASSIRRGQTISAVKSKRVLEMDKATTTLLAAIENAFFETFVRAEQVFTQLSVSSDAFPLLRPSFIVSRSRTRGFLAVASSSPALLSSRSRFSPNVSSSDVVSFSRPSYCTSTTTLQANSVAVGSSLLHRRLFARLLPSPLLTLLSFSFLPR